MSTYKRIFYSVDGGLAYDLSVTQATSSRTGKSIGITYLDDEGRIVFGLGEHPTVTRDVQLLLDKIALNIYTTLGDNYFSPGMGTLITRLQGQADNVDRIDLEAQITLTLSALQNAIIAEQATQQLTDNQKLLELKFSQIYRDSTDPTRLLVEVLVVTAANQEYIMTV